MNRDKRYLAATAIVLIFISVIIGNTQALDGSKITPTDRFEIPNKNGAIIFAVNATAEKAEFRPDVWEFAGLRFGNFSQQQNLNLTASAMNSDVRITSYTFARSNTSLGTLRIRYTVEGKGEQTFNFGPIPKDGIWSVTINNVFLGQEDGWTVSKDGTVTVTGAQSKSNVSIIYYFYPEFFVAILHQNFLQRNSVAIATAIILVATITIAIAAKKITKKQQEQTNPVYGNRVRDKEDQ